MHHTVGRNCFAGSSDYAAFYRINFRIWWKRRILPNGPKVSPTETKDFKRPTASAKQDVSDAKHWQRIANSVCSSEGKTEIYFHCTI